LNLGFHILTILSGFKNLTGLYHNPSFNTAILPKYFLFRQIPVEAGSRVPRYIPDIYRDCFSRCFGTFLRLTFSTKAKAFVLLSKAKQLCVFKHRRWLKFSFAASLLHPNHCTKDSPTSFYSKC
jgi:hypothetical protein